MLNLFEGRGYLVRTAIDGPFRGGMTLAALVGSLGEKELSTDGEWDALALAPPLTRLATAFPGGLDLLLDPESERRLALAENAKAFCFLIAALPSLRWHLSRTALEYLSPCFGGSTGLLPLPNALWLHDVAWPTGELGALWRQGLLTWVPTADHILPAQIPGLGPLGWEDERPISLWGEWILPLPALLELDARDVANVLVEQQAQVERNFSLRLSQGAWPERFPFQRKRAAWRLGLIGGREAQAMGLDWEELATRLENFLEQLHTLTRTTTWVGTHLEAGDAYLLGRQAMGEGYPWRNALPMPPASPAFSAGLGTDPREVGPLESRAAFPEAFARLMASPPELWLRLPREAQEGAVDSFLKGLAHPGAIRWIPPTVAPPGPFLVQRPWEASGAFPPLLDVSQALQPGLFEDEV